jgi:hypothetical protein
LLAAEKVIWKYVADLMAVFFASDSNSLADAWKSFSPGSLFVNLFRSLSECQSLSATCVAYEWRESTSIVQLNMHEISPEDCFPSLPTHSDATQAVALSSAIEPSLSQLASASKQVPCGSAPQTEVSVIYSFFWSMLDVYAVSDAARFRNLT